jgi:hypothetical protein
MILSDNKIRRCVIIIVPMIIRRKKERRSRLIHPSFYCPSTAMTLGNDPTLLSAETFSWNNNVSPTRNKDNTAANLETIHSIIVLGRFFVVDDE